MSMRLPGACPGDLCATNSIAVSMSRRRYVHRQRCQPETVKEGMTPEPAV